jgi:hypothetical protein
MAAKTAMMAVVSAIQVMKRSGFVSAIECFPPNRMMDIQNKGGFYLIRKGLSIKLSHAARPLQRDVDDSFSQET